MKHRLTFLFSLVLGAVMFLTPAVSLAQKDYGLNSTVKSTDGLLPTTVAKATTVPQLVGNIVAIGLSVLGVVFFGLFLYSGIVWMTALGNGERVSQAKDTLQSAITGLIIVVAAYAISKFVFDNLVGTTTSSSSSAVVNSSSSAVPANAKEGDSCGKMMKYEKDAAGKMQCVTGCEYLGGTCGTKDSCVAPKTTTPNECPGDASIICCY